MLKILAHIVPTASSRAAYSGKSWAFVISLLIFALSLAGNAHAAICTSNAGAVNWNSAATWSCGNVPAAGDSVIIPNGSTVTLNATTNTLASLQVDFGGVLLVAGGGSDIYLGGNLINNGTLNLNPAAGNNYLYLAGNNVTSTFSGSGTWSLDQIDLNGSFGRPCNGSCTVELSGSPNLQFYNATPIAGSSANDTFNALGNATATVTLARAGNQTLTSTGITYPNLVLTGSGAKTPAGALNILGDLTLSGTATSTTAGVTAIGGDLSVGAGTTLTVAGFNFAVTGSTSVSGTLTHSNATGTKTYSGGVTINGGGVWNNSANENITLQGGLTNNGTFTAGTGVYTFNTNSQSFGGTTATTIPNITVTGVTLTNNGTLTVTTALAGTGTLSNAGTLDIGFAGPPAITTLDASPIGNTVNYNRAGIQTVEQTSYYHLTLSNSGAKTITGVTAIGGNLNVSGSATMTGNAGFTVTGAFNYTSTGATTLTAATPVSIGTFNQTAGTLIDNGNTITVTGTGAGVWTRSGGTFTPTGTVIFTGPAPQIGASNFNNLTINVGNGNTATLTGNVTAGGVLTLTSGVFSTAANIVEVTSSCATGIVRTGGSVSGDLRLHYPAGSTTCLFPMGDAADYTPVTVTMNGVTSSLANSVLTARTGPGDHPDTTALLSGIDPVKSVNRTWTLTNGALLTFATYDATFAFVNGDLDGGAATANFIIRRKSGGSWTSPAVGAKNPNDTTATGMNGFGVFAIGEYPMPSIVVVKTVSTYSDPYNNTTNPKAIPGAVMDYSATMTNTGSGQADAMVFTDPISVDSSLFVGDMGGAGTGPVLVTDGAVPSGLIYTYIGLGSAADSISFSNDNGATYTYTPTPDANGFDGAVTHFRIAFGGNFNPAVGVNQPSLTLQFKVRVK